MVLGMSLQMLGQLINPAGQQCDLYLRRAGVGLAGPVVAYDFFFLFLRQHLTNIPFLHVPTYLLAGSTLTYSRLFTITTIIPLLNYFAMNFSDK